MIKMSSKKIVITLVASLLLLALLVIIKPKPQRAAYFAGKLSIDKLAIELIDFFKESDHSALNDLRYVLEENKIETQVSNKWLDIVSYFVGKDQIINYNVVRSVEKIETVYQNLEGREISKEDYNKLKYSLTDKYSKKENLEQLVTDLDGYKSNAKVDKFLDTLDRVSENVYAELPMPIEKKIFVDLIELSLDNNTTVKIYVLRENDKYYIDLMHEPLLHINTIK